VTIIPLPRTSILPIPLDVIVGYIIPAGSSPDAERGAVLLEQTMRLKRDDKIRQTVGIGPDLTKGYGFNYVVKVARVPETLAQMQISTDPNDPPGTLLRDPCGEGGDRSAAWGIFEREFGKPNAVTGGSGPRQTRRICVVWGYGGVAGGYHVQPWRVQDGTQEDIGEAQFGSWDLMYYLFGTNTECTPVWARAGRDAAAWSKGVSWSLGHEIDHLFDENAHGRKLPPAPAGLTMNQLVPDGWRDRQIAEQNGDYVLDAGIAWLMLDGSTYISVAGDTLQSIAVAHGINAGTWSEILNARNAQGVEINGLTFGAMIVREGARVWYPYSTGYGEPMDDDAKNAYINSNVQFVYQMAVPGEPPPGPEPVTLVEISVPARVAISVNEEYPIITTARYSNGSHKTVSALLTSSQTKRVRVNGQAIVGVSKTPGNSTVTVTATYEGKQDYVLVTVRR
jgi:hypothetical protein